MSVQKFIGVPIQDLNCVFCSSNGAHTEYPVFHHSLFHKGTKSNVVQKL